MSYIPAELIKKKRRGEAHSKEELTFLIEGFVSGKIQEAQVGAWVMAVYFQGMTSEETASLTEVMKDTGTSFDFSKLNHKAVDKHSTGGVGDKTSLILGPIAAAAGVSVPMIAGRGLGHTGGTLDKLESIAGLNVWLGAEQFQAQVAEIGLAIMGQTKDICPADRKLYALRDVTGTIDSLPLICASIMSKKLAEGASALVLDVKFGSGAFMKTPPEAETLARELIAIGEHHKVQTRALITNMDQPLGRYAGNALEVKECVEILKGSEEYQDTLELSLKLAAHMIHLAEIKPKLEDALTLAKEVLRKGLAYDKFIEFLTKQGSSELALDQLKSPKFKRDFSLHEKGFIESMNCEFLGIAAIELGAGRKIAKDQIDPAAGLEFHKKIGHEVIPGEPVVSMYSSDEQLFDHALPYLEKAYFLTEGKPEPKALVLKELENPDV